MCVAQRSSVPWKEIIGERSREQEADFKNSHLGAHRDYVGGTNRLFTSGVTRRCPCSIADAE